MDMTACINKWYVDIKEIKKLYMKTDKKYKQQLQNMRIQEFV